MKDYQYYNKNSLKYLNPVPEISSRNNSKMDKSKGRESPYQELVYT